MPHYSLFIPLQRTCVERQRGSWQKSFESSCHKQTTQVYKSAPCSAVLCHLQRKPVLRFIFIIEPNCAALLRSETANFTPRCIIHEFRTCKEPLPLTPPFTHTHTRAHTRTHTHTYTHIRTRTHTELSTCSPPVPIPCPLSIIFFRGALKGDRATACQHWQTGGGEP